MKQTMIFTVLMMLAVQVSVGQTLKTYSGLYEDGKATYTYYEDENGERVKHGKFTYNKTDKGLGVGGGMAVSYATTISASGNYKNGMKDGKWICKFFLCGNHSGFFSQKPSSDRVKALVVGYDEKNNIYKLEELKGSI